mgnify:FL=1
MTSSSLHWVHEDPKYAIEETIRVSRDNRTTDILGIGPMCCEFLNQMYSINTIGELEDHIAKYGFPEFLKSDTRFVLSVRIGLKACVK